MNYGCIIGLVASHMRIGSKVVVVGEGTKWSILNLWKNNYFIIYSWWVMYEYALYRSWIIGKIVVGESDIY